MINKERRPGWRHALGLLLLLPTLVASAANTEAQWRLTLHLNPGVLEMWRLDIRSEQKSLPSARFEGYSALSATSTSAKARQADFKLALRLGLAEHSIETGTLSAEVSDKLNAVSLRGADGHVWLVADMPHRHAQEVKLDWRYMNLRPSAWLAKRLGQPLLAEQVIGSMDLLGPHPVENLSSKGFATCPSPRPVWPSAESPADIQLLAIDGVQAMRCQGCSTTSTDGQVVISPDATLLNIGQSDVPWYSKFTSPQPPYNNDQHPMLVWAMYRIDADGSLHPLGTSGVKHAFFAQNDMCTCPGANVLYRGCSDLYSRSTNDAAGLLGPREEIAPRPTLWGRCGSVFDPNCDSVQDSSGYAQTGYDRRLVVKESRMQAAQHPGASYWIEAWYVVRDDSNLDTSFGTRQITPNKVDAAWAISVSGAFANGPLINRWVDPNDADALTDSQLVDVADGRLRLAVKVDNLGDRYRYRYALMNLDYAKASFSGSEPGLLRVLAQSGAAALSWALPRDDANSITWRDESGDSSSNWRLGSGTDLRVEASNSAGLGWGRMLVIEFSSRFAPQSGTVMVGLGGAESASVTTLVPVVADRVLRDGFE